MAEWVIEPLADDHERGAFSCGKAPLDVFLQAQAGQYDQAINAFKELAQRKDGVLPIDGILMQLGRAYVGAGKPADAQQTFNRLVEEFPTSPYITDARRELDDLKKT